MKSSPKTLSVICKEPSFKGEAQRCATALGISLDTQELNSNYQLIFEATGVSLTPTDKKNHGAIFVDFCKGKVAHRRKHGGGKGQLIAKACGLKGQRQPHILDATAGLGQDAFVLASLGCQMTLLERSPVAFALLNDGLTRARTYSRENDVELEAILSRITLLSNDAITYLQNITPPVADVIYLDPMFPNKHKSAAVNKNMQAFHNVIGMDADDSELLEAALKKAHFRVVVKRPRLAPSIGDQKPSFTINGKSSRYDVYALKKMQ